MATMLSTRSMELKHPHSHNPSINAHFDMNSPAPQQQQQQTPTPTVSDDELVAEAAADEKAINDILTGSVTGLSFDDSGGDQRFTVNDGQEEEKAEDAVDYEDMDELADDDDEDGDLPEEEDSEETKARRARGDDEDEDDFLKDLMNEAAGTGGMSAREAGSGGNLPDDLFGDMDVDMEDQGIGGSFGDRMELDSAGEMGMSFDGSGAKAGSGNIGYSGTFIKEEDTDEDDDALFNNYSFGTTQQQEPTKEELLQKWFPDFRHHEVLNFNALIPVKTATLPSRLTRVPKPCIPTKLSFEAAIDTERSFMKTTTAKHLTSNTEGVISIIQEESGDDSERQDSAIEDGSSEQLRQREIEIVCQDWDSMIDPPSDIEPIPEHNLHDMVMDGEQNVYELDIRSTKRRKLIHNYIDNLPDNWLDDDAIMDGNLPITTRVTLDLNDPYLLVDIRQPNDVRRTRRIGGEFKRRVNKDLIQRYNISNDEAYDLLKENKQSKVRSTIGQLTVEHSMPALRLQTPYYKTRLNVKEARSFHRPTLSFQPNVEIRFTKVKSRKKKNLRGKDIKTILNTTHDLSLSDNSNYVLMEYSEEYPTVMSNFGMGSRLINYYRRKGPEDESRPKYELGETQVLMPQDRSPFWNFGTVDPGEIVPTLYNRMIRAPIFKQTPKSTDFLVIRSTDMTNGQRYYMRTIPHLYVVGQVFPVTEVPGPSSRKMTTVAKNRLKMVCYRIMKRKENHAISLRDIAPHFPESNDPQNRSKLKEFLQMNKEIGLWEMKVGETIPDENTVRAMVDPESVCLLEAMQVGFRHLQDAGYGKNLDEEDDDEDKAGSSIEQMLAPWKTTKNFLHATQGKAMLKLHGEGDPSGRGEAFSFIRTSMKGGFKAIGESVEEKMDKARLKELGGHSYNVARQQKAYEEAIEQIWKAQHKSLSSTEEHPDMELEDAHRDDHMDDLFDEGKTPRSEAVTPAPWGDDMRDETMTQFSRLSASSQRNKVLRIVREVRKDGKLVKEIETVTEPKVIRQYLQRRRAIEAENVKLENLVPTGDAETDKQQKKIIQLELQRLLRNKDRREARERQGNKKNGSFLEDPLSPGVNSPGGIGSPMSISASVGSPAPAKQSTTRKCANCGMVGHIRTNKKLCPKLNPALGGASAVGSPTPGPSDVMSPLQ